LFVHDTNVYIVKLCKVLPLSDYLRVNEH